MYTERKFVYICPIKHTLKNKNMSKLRKAEILNSLGNGSTLVKKFDRMYGTYFYLINIDSTCIYNVHKSDCKTITNMNHLIKKMIDPNTFEFTINQSNN